MVELVCASHSNEEKDLKAKQTWPKKRRKQGTLWPSSLPTRARLQVQKSWRQNIKRQVVWDQEKGWAGKAINRTNSTQEENKHSCTHTHTHTVSPAGPKPGKEPRRVSRWTTGAREGGWEVTPRGEGIGALRTREIRETRVVCATSSKLLKVKTA